jgi:hypothetical protein
MIVFEMDLEELILLSGAIGALAIQAKTELKGNDYEELLTRCRELLERLTNLYNASQIGGLNEHVIN